MGKTIEKQKASVQPAKHTKDAKLRIDTKLVEEVESHSHFVRVKGAANPPE